MQECYNSDLCERASEGDSDGTGVKPRAHADVTFLEKTQWLKCTNYFVKGARILSKIMYLFLIRKSCYQFGKWYKMQKL